ncbi:MAG: 30S ribosomal protein S20 [Candidatus Saccharibacteria bacterium]
MPIIKSAKKRTRTASKATARNTKTKRTFRSAIKAFQASLTTGKDAAKSHSKAQSTIDKAVKKGVLHKNTAARKKSRLAKAAKAAGAKTSGTKKAVAKKPATKKAPAKKTTKK